MKTTVYPMPYAKKTLSAFGNQFPSSNLKLAKSGPKNFGGSGGGGWEGGKF